MKNKLFVKNIMGIALLMVITPLVAKAFQATNNLPVDKVVHISKYSCDVHVDHKNINEDVLLNLHSAEVNIYPQIKKSPKPCGRGGCDSVINPDLVADLNFQGKIINLSCYENF